MPSLKPNFYSKLIKEHDEIKERFDELSEYYYKFQDGCNSGELDLIDLLRDLKELFKKSKKFHFRVSTLLESQKLINEEQKYISMKDNNESYLYDIKSMSNDISYLLKRYGCLEGMDLEYLEIYSLDDDDDDY